MLDFGCGDLLLATLLPERAEVDGVDVSPTARRAARAARPSARVFAGPEVVPARTYDAVVASSVLQYLPDVGAVERWVADAARWLRPDARCGVVVTDLPTPDGRRVDDGLDLLVHLRARLGPGGALREVLRTARRSPGRLLGVDASVLVAAADRAGLVGVRLDRNLSPLRHRSTVVLTPR